MEDPQVGLRAVTDDPDRATRLLRGFSYGLDLVIPVEEAEVDDGYAVGTDLPTASAMARGDGSLGSTDAFRAAVPDAEDATAVAYVDLSTVLDAFPDGEGFRRSDHPRCSRSASPRRRPSRAAASSSGSPSVPEPS